MTNNTKKQILLAVALLAAAGYASAHDQFGSLGLSASATDYYVVNCFDDGSGPAYQMYYDLTDLTPYKSPVPTIPTLSVLSGQVTKDLMALTTSDLVVGDGNPGPSITVMGGAAAPGQGSGPGNYFITVDKSKATLASAVNKGIQSYHFTYHCQTKQSVHTGTEITQLQDE